MYRLATCFWVSDCCTHSTGFVGCAENRHSVDSVDNGLRRGAKGDKKGRTDSVRVTKRTELA